MGERKGTNKYYPPDYDPKKGGLNSFLGTHALRERARKLHLGILIIRFEMPYNIWCEGCGNHIGMGVRYNAEKTKIGMYYTTPIYQFRMKCHLCDNHIEIKTDPGALDYVIVSGARRQERRWDATQNGQVVPEDKATSRRLFDDAMFKLEHGEQDVGKGKTAQPRIKKLAEIQDRVKDDYLANRILRDEMRAKRKVSKASAAVDDALRKKASLDIALLPENEDDARVAALMRLTPALSSEERQSTLREAIEQESIFGSSSKAALGAAESKSDLEAIVNRHKESQVKKLARPMKRDSLGIVIKKKTKDPPIESMSQVEEPTASSSKDTSEAAPGACSENNTRNHTSKPNTISLCDYGSSDDSSN